MKDVIIGIDAGTSLIKSVAFDLSGKQIATFSLPNKYEVIDGAGAEQDIARTWQDTAATLRGLAEKVPDLATRAAAMAVTGQGDGTWLIDKDRQPVAPAWLWLDARAAAIVDEFRASSADIRRFEITATGLAACQQGAHMMWMDRHAPELLAATATAMHCKDWLYLNLTGQWVTDPSEGCFTFGDFRDRTYSQEVIEALGLQKYRHLLPPMVDGTQQTAALTAEAATATGLTQGTPVALGYVDFICTALGAGLYDPDAMPGCTVIGSTGMHMRLVQSPDDVVLSEDRSGYTMAMPVPGVYAQMHSNMASTLNIDWLLGLASELLATQNVERTVADLIPLLDTWIPQAAPAGLIYQPYVSEAGERGPFIDGNARAGFIGLSTRHGFADLARAVFEGLAFAARHCYDAMGALPGEIRLTGGAARSKSLRKIIGSALSADIRTSAREEAGAAGAAMMAAVAIGQYDTMDACAADWVTPLLGDLEPPDQSLAEIYAETFPAYIAAQQALRPVWKMMAERQVGSP